MGAGLRRMPLSPLLPGLGIALFRSGFFLPFLGVSLGCGFAFAFVVGSLVISLALVITLGVSFSFALAVSGSFAFRLLLLGDEDFHVGSDDVFLELGAESAFQGIVC